MPNPPKPTALRLIEGNRGKRALPKQEPDPTYLNDLTAPAWLPADAARVWDDLAPKLRAARLLTEVDVYLLAMGCVSVAQYQNALTRTGPALVKSKAVEDEEGNPVETGEQVNPWFIAQSMSFKQIMTIFREFGLSPAARTRIAVNPQGNLFDDQEKGTGSYF